MSATYTREWLLGQPKRELRNILAWSEKRTIVLADFQLSYEQMADRILAAQEAREVARGVLPQREQSDWKTIGQILGEMGWPRRHVVERIQRMERVVGAARALSHILNGYGEEGDELRASLHALDTWEDENLSTGGKS